MFTEISGVNISGSINWSILLTNKGWLYVSLFYINYLNQLITIPRRCKACQWTINEASMMLHLICTVTWLRLMHNIFCCNCKIYTTHFAVLWDLHKTWRENVFLRQHTENDCPTVYRTDCNSVWETAFRSKYTFVCA